jgi:pilus assembly protein Flp/PilA
MSILARRRHGRRALGQSMSEGILIVFLVAVGTVGLVGLVGDNIRVLFGSSAAAIAGNQNVANTGAQTQRTKWNLKGGSLSAYNPGGTMDRPAPAPGGFNPGGAGDNATNGAFNPGGSGDSANHAPAP